MKVEKIKREKTGGRIAGTPNRSTQEVRLFIQSFLERQFDNIDAIFEELSAKEKIQALTKLLPYIVPKQIQMDLNATHTQEVKHDLSKLTDEELHFILAIHEKAEISNK